MRLFPVKAAMNAFGITAINTEGLTDLQTFWDGLYTGTPAWLRTDDFYFNIPAIVTYQVSRLAVSEAVISTNNDVAQELCNTLIAEKLQPALQLALAYGDCVLRPWIDANKKTHVDIYKANEFIPTAFLDSLVTSGIFVDTKIERRSDGTIARTYTKLECQTFDPSARRVTVSVRAFVKNGEATAQDIGAPTSLENVPEWATITPDFTVENVDGPLFVFIKTPWLPKCTINTAFGAALYADAADQIETVNVLLNQLDWEYKSGERHLVVDDSAIPVDADGNQIYNKGDSRLYRKLTGSGSADGSVKDLYGDYTPQLRTNEYITNLKTQLALASIACHMDADYLQFDRQTGAVTATQVIYSAKESYATVCNVQTKMALPAIKHLLASFGVLLTAASAPSYSPEEIADVAVAWNDGVMNDPQTEHDNALAEVAQGLMSKKYFLTHIRGLSDEEADAELARIKDETPVPVNPFAPIGG